MRCRVEPFRRGAVGACLSSAVLLLSGCSLPASFEGPKPAQSYMAEESRSVAPVRVLRPALPAPSLAINPEVQRELQTFTGNARRHVEMSLERRDSLWPTIGAIFQDEGVPPELASVALIESGFDPHARSPSGAVGVWQFMKGTARVYGLKVGWFEDQRKDVILSTIAAARHLKDLFRAYRDWELALAAYNAGSAAVDRALNRSGSTSFWELSRRGLLRSETRRYVPKFIAAALITANPDQYGFTNFASREELQNDTQDAIASNRAGDRRSPLG